MGQHKYNPVVQLVKEGKLLPKQRRIGTREAKRILEGEMTRLFYQKLYSKKEGVDIVK